MSEPWNVRARKKLIDLNMNRRQLAEIIGVNYSVMCAVLNGSVIRESVKQKICSYLKID